MTDNLLQAYYSMTMIRLKRMQIRSVLSCCSSAFGHKGAPSELCNGYEKPRDRNQKLKSYFSLILLVHHFHRDFLLVKKYQLTDMNQ